MKRKLLFVINENAGTRSKKGIEEFLRRECDKENLEYQFLQLGRNTNNYSIQFMAEEFEATDLIACGGDGTINLVANACKDTNMRLGIIPAGSGNGLALSVGIPMKMQDAWKNILKGESQKIDSFYVNKRFGCMLTGLGMDADVAERFSHSHRRGLVTYTRETLMAFFRASPYQFQVKIGGFEFFTESYFISIANSNQFGNNVTIAPCANLCDGLLDIVIVQKMPKARMPFALLNQIRGNNKLRSIAEKVTSGPVVYLQAPEIEITNLKHAPLHIDGDPVEAEENIQVKIVKENLNLMF